MSRILLGVAAVVAVMMGATAPMAEATSETLMPYGSGGYSYEVVNHGALPGFEAPGFDARAAGFTPNGRSPFSNRAACGYPSATNWPANTDLLTRKNLYVPARASKLSVSLAIDNNAIVYWNGTQIGSATHNGCATANSFTFRVPPRLLRSGRNNLLAVRAVDTGLATFFDATVHASTDWRDTLSVLVHRELLKFYVLRTSAQTLRASLSAGGRVTPADSISMLQGVGGIAPSTVISLGNAAALASKTASLVGATNEAAIVRTIRAHEALLKLAIAALQQTTKTGLATSGGAGMRVSDSSAGGQSTFLATIERTGSQLDGWVNRLADEFQAATTAPGRRAQRDLNAGFLAAASAAVQAQSAVAAVGQLGQSMTTGAAPAWDSCIRAAPHCAQALENIATGCAAAALAIAVTSVGSPIAANFGGCATAVGIAAAIERLSEPNLSPSERELDFALQLLGVAGGAAADSAVVSRRVAPSGLGAVLGAKGPVSLSRTVTELAPLTTAELGMLKVYLGILTTPTYHTYRAIVEGLERLRSSRLASVPRLLEVIRGVESILASHNSRGKGVPAVASQGNVLYPFWQTMRWVFTTSDCTNLFTSGYSPSGAIGRSIFCGVSSNGPVNINGVEEPNGTVDYVYFGAGSHISYTFMVPRGSSEIVSYGIPEGGYLNNAPARVTGVPPAMTVCDGGTSPTDCSHLPPPPARASKKTILWKSYPLSPGRHTVTLSGSANLYGFWIAHH